MANLVAPSTAPLGLRTMPLHSTLDTTSVARFRARLLGHTGTWILLLLLVVAAAYLSIPRGDVQANVVKAADQQAFNAIVGDLTTAASGISQSMKAVTENGRLLRCLEGIHSEGSKVLAMTIDTNDLLAIAALMKDRSDEAVAILALRSSVTQLEQFTIASRHTVQAITRACSEESVASTRGQAILAVYSRLSAFLDPLLARVRESGH